MPELNPVTSLKIDSGVVAQRDQFAFCRDGLFDLTGIVIERDEPCDAPFDLKITLHQSSGLMLSRYEFGTPFKLQRTYQSIARTDQEFICMHYRVRGTDLASFFRGEDHPTCAGNILCHDLTQQYVIQSKGFIGYTLYLDRSLLLDHVPDVDHLHGSHMPDTPLTQVFKAMLPSAFDQIARANAGEAASLSDAVTSLATDAIKLQMINDLESSAVGQMSVLRAVINHIKQNCHRRDCTPDSIARAVGVSRAKLYRVCQPYDTPMDLVRQVRLRKAAEVLKITADANIASLAATVGFSGRQAFTRAFTAEYGASPKEYRGLMRSPASKSAPGGRPADQSWEKFAASFKAAQIA